VPVVIGENEPTMAVAEALLARGFFAQGIRHPSVPQGTARLRLTVMSSHRPVDLDDVADALAELLAVAPARRAERSAATPPRAVA
jgi:7-keto-8-aminopelargonate synthetase-like enzyme